VTISITGTTVGVALVLFIKKRNPTSMTKIIIKYFMNLNGLDCVPLSYCTITVDETAIKGVEYPLSMYNYITCTQKNKEVFN